MSPTGRCSSKGLWLFLLATGLAMPTGAIIPFAGATAPAGYLLCNGVAVSLASVCFVILAISLVLFVYTPGVGVQWPVLAGAVAVIAVGEVTIRLTERQRAAVVTGEAGRSS